jgi:hypothetical protein
MASRSIGVSRSRIGLLARAEGMTQNSPSGRKDGRRWRKLRMTPEQRERISVMRAARRRGWTLEKIGIAAGVSHQRVEQLLGKEGKEDAPAPEKLKRRTKTVVRATVPCLICRKPLSLSPREMRIGAKFCSTKCYGLYERKVSSAKVVEAIDLRECGAYWKEVARFAGCTQQAIQIRIWKYLHAQGMLTERTVKHIWSPRPTERRVHWSTRWIEKSTGISINGPIKQYPNYSKQIRRKPEGLPVGVILQSEEAVPDP